MAATSLADSNAALEKQASNLGLDPVIITGLKRLGVNNYGRLAFACGQPGAPVVDNDVRQLLQDAAPGRATTVGDIVVMKRLIFEAQTSMVALSQAQADPSGDPSTRKMPAAERSHPLETQKRRLIGLDLQGPLEVAHQVYDLINGMLEADAIKYLAPGKCITRMQEITSAKPPKELRLDSNGQGILVKDAPSEQTCPTSTELDVMEAMTRRSLAFDATGLIDYHLFQKWVQHLFQLLRQAPPPGFKAPNVTQLLRADRQAFVRMQELSRDGIKPAADGTRPLDAIIEDMHRDHSVIYYMLPVPEAPKASKPAGSNPPASSNWKQQPSQGNQGNSSWKTKQTWKQTSKSKQSSWNNEGKLPVQLKGCNSALADGTRICFAYNISSCDNAKPGESCNKGKHVCATKNCGEAHPHFSCPKK